MTSFVPVKRMAERLEVDKTESDLAVFMCLLYFGELLTKIVTCAMCSAVRDDVDRHRYRLLYSLVRADGIGDWASALDEILTGPCSQYLHASARSDQRELAQKVHSDSWQFKAVELMASCCKAMGVQHEQIGGTASLRQWFPLFCGLRNKTRGHGAVLGKECSSACRELENSVKLLAYNLHLFKRPWAYLHKNLSGTYRVTPMSDETEPFVALKTGGRSQYPDGVYAHFDSIVRVDLMFSDPDLSDFMLPNGRFRSARFELLSYVSGKTSETDGSMYLDPVQPLPESQTHPLEYLDVRGKCFTNVPPAQTGYINRPELEERLEQQLLLDQHPIITLTGSGGIGKTSLALAVLQRILGSSCERYDLVIWFSARDIDLLEEGPKPVRPHSISLTEFAEFFVRLAQPKEANQKDFGCVEYFSSVLGGTSLGRVLLVFDNFETVLNPIDVFKWIDTYVRPPNKVLITTRIREFVGDYPLEVGGLTEGESRLLIDSFSKRLGVREILTPQYIKDLYSESGGHPYVIKIMLGEIAKSGKLTKPERIVATRDEILTSLFERTYANLTPTAQRMFLLLSNWRSVIPQVAVEAVVLRPGNDRLDVAKAIDDLYRSSLIEQIVSDSDNEVFVSVPLAAATFGKRKLTASPHRASVEADTALLLDFGAIRKEEVRSGLAPRIRRMLGRVAERVAKGDRTVEEVEPVVEFLAGRSPVLWMDVADFYEDQVTAESREKAKNALRRYVESPTDSLKAQEAWRRLADLCSSTADYQGEVHALVGMCETQDIPLSVASSAANRVSAIHAVLKKRGIALFDTDEKRILVRRMVNVMRSFSDDFDATDCSRLAWLHLQLGDEKSALQVARHGLEMDPFNEHCRNIVSILHGE